MKTVFALRDVRIASLTGHIIRVPANTPVEIPDKLYVEALAAGCVEYDPQVHKVNEITPAQREKRLLEERARFKAALPERAPALPPEKEQKEELRGRPPLRKEITTDALRDAMLDVLKEADPKNFKAGGVPKVQAFIPYFGRPPKAEQVLEVFLQLSDVHDPAASA